MMCGANHVHLVSGPGGGAGVRASPCEKAAGSTSALRALVSQVLFTATCVALHDVALLVLGVPATTMALACRALAMSLAMPLEVGIDIVLRVLDPVEPAPFALRLSPEAMKLPTKLSHWFGRVPSPHSLCSSVGHVDGLCCFGLGHLRDVRASHRACTVIRGCVGVCASFAVYQIWIDNWESWCPFLI